MRQRAILLPSIVLVLAGCLGGRVTPAAVAPSLDGWRDLGLTCSGPTEDNVPSGLLQWSCHGAVRGAEVTATLDGDDQGVFAITATLPAGTAAEAIPGAFGDLVDATPALAAAQSEIGPWLEAHDDPSAYGEAGSVAEFGTSRVKLLADESFIVLAISPGPRHSVEAAPS